MTRKILRVVDVKPLSDSRLSVEFSDGTAGIADLANHLTDILEPLRDPAVFNRAAVDGSGVSWGGDADVDAEFLYALAHQLPPPTTGEDVAANHMQVSLRQLRRMTGKTQAEVAAAARLAQSEVSRIEGRSDVLLSTLRRIVGAMGGEIDIVARVGSHVVVLDGLGELIEGLATPTRADRRKESLMKAFADFTKPESALPNKAPDSGR
jgi:transcriptional regulator with XRE-family HTH domain